MDAAQPLPRSALESVRFVDAKHGWIAGQEHTLGFTQMPFLLATDDGGVSWSPWSIQPVDDDRSGAILEYRFDSPEHGYVVIERIAAESDPFELYETYNGGRAWSVREISSERPKIPGSLRRDPTVPWQLQEEPGSGVYLLQRQSDDGGWSDAARFAATLGSCTQQLDRL